MKFISRKQHRCYTIFSLIAAILLCIARILISKAYLEPGIEHYENGAMAPNLLHLLIVLCAFACFSAFLILFKNESRAVRAAKAEREAKEQAAKEAEAAQDVQEKKEPKKKQADQDLAAELSALTLPSPSQLTVFAAIFCGFMLIAYDLMAVYNMYKDSFRVIAPLMGMPSTQTITKASALVYVCSLLMNLFAAVYFLKTAFSQGMEKKSKAFDFFSLSPALCFILMEINAYFDATLAFNSPVKMLRLTVLLVPMLYAIQESRLVIGIPREKLYFPISYLTILFCGIHAVSDAVLYAMGIVSLWDGYMGVAVEFSYMLYVLARQKDFATSAEPMLQ